MQGSFTERMRSKRMKGDSPITNSKNDKLTRRNRRLHRAIKQGEYQESNTVRQDDNE